MPTADEARRELARRELARREAARHAPPAYSGGVGVSAPQPAPRPSPHPAPRRVGMAEDAARSYGTGVLQGTDAMSDPTGVQAQARRMTQDQRAKLAAQGVQVPAWVNQSLDLATNPVAAMGLQYDPQTTIGEYARTLGQFTPGALAPGSALARAANVVVPALTSETAGQGARAAGLDQQSENVWRMLGALGGGVVAGVRPKPGGSVPRPAPRPGPRVPAASAVDTPSGGFQIVPRPAKVVRAASERINRGVNADQAGGGPTREEVAARILAGERPWAAGGPNLAMVAEDVASRPGPARTRLERSAQTVADSVPAEVRGAIGEASGARGDILAHLDEVKAQREAAVAPLRDRAFGAPVDPVAYRSRIEPLMPRVPKQALNFAAEIARRDGRNPDEIGLVSVRRSDGSGTRMDVEVRNPTMETLHYIKKGMDQELSGFRDTFGRLDLEGQPMARATSDVRSAFGKALRGLNSDYDTFMQSWGDDSDLLQANALGRGALTGRGGLRGQQLEATYRDMSAQAKDEYQRGIGDALLDEVRQSGDVQTLRRLLKNEEVAARVRLAFPGDSFDQFMARAKQIVQRQNVANQILGNSRTAVRSAMRAENEQPDATGYVSDAMTLDAPGIARRGVRDVARATSGKIDWGNRRQIDALVGEAMDNPDLFNQLLTDAERQPGLDPALLDRLRQLKIERFSPAAVAIGASGSDRRRRPGPPQR